MPDFPDLDSIIPCLLRIVIKEKLPPKVAKPIATKLIYSVDYYNTNCAVYSLMRVALGSMAWECTLPGRYRVEQVKKIWETDRGRFRLKNK